MTRIYLGNGDMVEATSVDFCVTEGGAALQFQAINDAANLRFWHAEDETYYDVKWDFSGVGTPARLYYEKSE